MSSDDVTIRTARHTALTVFPHMLTNSVILETKNEGVTGRVSIPPDMVDDLIRVLAAARVELSKARSS